MNHIEKVQEFLKNKTSEDLVVSPVGVHKNWRAQVLKHNRTSFYTIRKGFSGYRPASIRNYIENDRFADSKFVRSYIKGDTFSVLDIVTKNEEEAIEVCYELAKYFIDDPLLSLDRGSNFFIKELPESLIEIVDGALAGDGSIMRASDKSAYLLYQIGGKQKEHIEEFRECLTNYGYSGVLRMYKTKARGIYHDVWALTWFLWAFSEHRDRWYDSNGKKRLPEDVRNTPTFWRWFYAGDGCFQRVGKFSGQVTLCANDFSTLEVERLQSMLLIHGIESKKWAIPNRGDSENPQWLIWIFSNNARKFLEMTSPAVKGVEYKWSIPEVPVYVCKYCKQDFRPYRADMQYCCPSCREKANRVKI